MRRLIVYALLLAMNPAAAQSQPADQTAGQSLMVELSSFSFTPRTLTLRQGARYRIRFVNIASGGHDFAAREFFAASTIAPEDIGKVNNGKIGLRARESVEVTLTPNRAGTYKVRCTHFMHGAFGMKGSIVVQ